MCTLASLSPSFAAPAVAPAVHEQAMHRLQELTGLVPVEYPTTRRLGAPAQDSAKKKFEIYIPLQGDERTESGEAGKGTPIQKKG